MTATQPVDRPSQESTGLLTRIGLKVTGGKPFSDLPIRRKVVLSQLPMFFAVLFACTFALLSNAKEIYGDTLFTAGVVLVLLNTVASFAVPWEKFRSEFTYLVIPAAGMIAACLMSMGAYYWLSGMTLLIAFPVFWFAWSGVAPRLTLMLSFVLPLATTLLQLWHNDIPFTLINVVRPLLIPLVILALASTTVIVEYNTSLKNRMLRESLATSRRQANLLNAVLNAANVGVVVVDRDGNDVLMNDIQRFQHRHAIPPEHPDPTEDKLLVRAVSPNFEVCPELMPSDQRPVLRAIRQEEFVDELIALGPLHDPIYSSTSARALFDDSGVYDGAVIMFKNVTPMITASKTKDRFLANVSHELRTPLTSILGYLELLEDEVQMTSGTKKSLDVISRNTNRLLSLVNDLLTVAAGRHQISVSAMDFGAVVQARLESMAPRASAAGIELNQGTLCHEQVLGDALRLGQVVDNLVSNSIKYTDRGGSVTVEMDCTEDEICLRVIDTGRGISEADLKQLFVRFFRSNDAQLSGLPGVGLGLAITRELVMAHGGTISAESEIGRGTTMTVRMPRKSVKSDSLPSAFVGQPATENRS
ncbi:sensor histidine kinase [Paeniglutamicibacter sp. NPDC091659]|uniref:sensor histidine kinase n=1 Tax=Paeniglutamicibacter sp. NPDC091659 TaxID=3364389 RepID=UPI003830F633